MLLVAKIGLVGDSGIGKTTLMNYIMGNNNNYLQPTIGVDFNIKPFIYNVNNVNKNKININWNIYDTAGQERFSPIIRTYYRICNIIILGFSDKDSFDRLDFWLDQIKDYNDKAKIFLVRYKIDINMQSNMLSITRREEQFGKIYNISVKNNNGIDILIGDINKYIYDNQDKMIVRETIEIENSFNLKSKCC
jgi:small GTP-binding protein